MASFQQLCHELSCWTSSHQTPILRDSLAHQDQEQMNWNMKFLDTMNDLKNRAESLLKDGPLKQEPSQRRIRVLQETAYIFDTDAAILVWEHQYYPQYYLPERSLQHAKESLLDGGEGYLISQIHLPGVSDSEKLPNAIHFQKGPLAGYIRLDFRAFSWFEEDDQIFVHPTDPYKRIDVRRSSRSIRIELAGVVLAESTFAEHLYETLLPVRYYLPWASVDWQYLKASSTTTECPYKGTASYFDVVINGKVYKDLVWWYRTALPEVIQVTNMVCFYNEKVDIILDGKKLDRPDTKFN